MRDLAIAAAIPWLIVAMLTATGFKRASADHGVSHPRRLMRFLADAHRRDDDRLAAIIIPGRSGTYRHLHHRVTR